MSDLEPEHAFGDYHSELVCFEDRSLFPAGIAQGMQFDGLPEGAQSVGMPLETIYTLADPFQKRAVDSGSAIRAEQSPRQRGLPTTLGTSHNQPMSTRVRCRPHGTEANTL